MTRKRTTRSIAISLILLSLLLIFSSVSFAETEVGRVTHLSGPLFAKKADGTTRALSIKSAVELGDTLVTEKKTYARIKFTDNSEINMRPGTQLKVSEYSFDQAKPKEDKVAMNLVKGGMRAITGMIGKRGDQDSYKLITETAVAGIRGTTYEVKICEGNCGSIPNGLYLFVLEGIINVSNKVGSQDVSAGQYVYVQTMTSIPTILPGNPGIDFTLPTSIADSPEGGEAKKADPGCIVR
ncbi:MAG: FecR domain-containing protein [Proteobacteria bacterium]|nr:FecR domain-containing protein [Pseudomonadota bacterium]